MLNNNLIKNNGNSNVFEKIAPINKYRDFNLPPDFFFDSFYLSTSGTVFTAKEINFAGNNISVVNSFIPGTLENFSLYYHTTSEARNILTTTQNIINPKTIQVLPSMVYEVQFNKLYRTYTSPNSPVVITNDNFTFTHNLANSTPILVLLSRDIRPLINESLKPDHFKYSFHSDIPTSASTSNNAIDVLHGWNDLVTISIAIDTFINPISIEILQKDRLGSFFSDFLVIPATTPFHETYILPERTSGSTRVIILGGGSSETGEIDIDFMFSPRG